MRGAELRGNGDSSMKPVLKLEENILTESDVLEKNMQDTQESVNLS